MKKYILLIAILFASCSAPTQEPKTAGYFLQDEQDANKIAINNIYFFIVYDL